MYLSELFKSWYTEERLKPFFDSSYIPQKQKFEKKDYSWLNAHQNDLEIPVNSKLINALNNGANSVLTGQQAMLKGGPLLVYYKAKSAIDHAKKMSLEWNELVVPIFWIAGDDSDLKEVNQIESLLTDQCEKLDIVEVANLEVQNYNQGFFVKEMAKYIYQWFGDDILIVNGGASDLRLKAQMTLSKLAESSVELEKKLLAKEELLAKHQIKSSVKVGKDRARVFKVIDKKRKRLKIGENYQDELLTHDVLSRPIIADETFNVCAHVLGPSEFSYFMLAEVLYKFLNRPLPALISRSHGILLREKDQRLIEKLKMNAFNFSKCSSDEILKRVEPEVLESNFENKKIFNLNLNELGDVNPARIEKLARQMEKLNSKTLKKIKTEKILNSNFYKNEIRDSFRWFASGRIQERHLSVNELEKNINDLSYLKNNWKGSSECFQELKV